MVFTRWPREDSFPVSGALGGTCRCLSRFCNILLQDLTLLHVKISRSTNFLSVCRRKLKLLTHLHTGKLQSHTLSQYTLATRQNFLSVCRRKLKLLTHLHTVSYNHIRFLNTRTRLVRILASSEYYSITS